MQSTLNWNKWDKKCNFYQLISFKNTMWYCRESMGKWQVATLLNVQNNTQDNNNCLQNNKCSSFKAREHCSDDQTCESFNGKVNWPNKIQVSLNKIKISVNAFSKRKEILHSYWKCVFHLFNLLKYLLYFKLLVCYTCLVYCISL